jgi:MFS family permease
MLSVLRIRPVRRLVLARLQSELGSGGAYVALVLIAYQRMHSGFAIGVVLLADFLPGIVLSTAFGALADRFSRRTLVIAAELLRAGAFIGLALVSSYAATVGLALLAGVGTALFCPAVYAALPALVTDEQRSPATALYSGVAYVGLTLGPALTALALLVSSPTVILALNGVTFILSALLLRSVPLGSAGRDPEGRDSFWQSTRRGISSAAQIPGLPVLLSIGATTVLAATLMNVAEPILATGPLHGGGAGYSLLVTAYGVGLVVGSFINGRAGNRIAGLRRRWLLAVALYGAAMLGSASAPSLTWAVATFAMTGLGNALLIGPEMRLFQELVGRNLLGRVFGLREMLTNTASVGAFVACGALLSLFGARSVFALGGATLLALSLIGAVAFRPLERAATSDAVPEPA